MTKMYRPQFSEAAPQPAPAFSITLSPPDVGWIELEARSGTITYGCALSFVFDPFEDIVHFLERIAKGLNADLLIHDEGHHHFFRAGGADTDGTFRFGVWNTLSLSLAKVGGYELAPVFDVRTDREEFVSAFYRAIDSIWGKPSLEAFRRAWLNCTENDEGASLEDGHPQALPEVRSMLLDRFLA